MSTHWYISLIAAAMLSMPLASHAQGRVPGVGGAVSPRVPTNATPATSRIIQDENVSQFQREMLETQTTARPINNQSVHQNRMRNNVMTPMQPVKPQAAPLIPPQPERPTAAPPERQVTRGAYDKKPDFPREQRNTPSKQGSKIRPMHGN